MLGNVTLLLMGKGNELRAVDIFALSWSLDKNQTAENKKQR